MRHRSAWVLPVVAAMLATGLLLGCIPWQRIELSPDGRTLYLTLNDEAGAEPDETSNIYTLDLETVEVKALTDGPGEKVFWMLSADGKALVYLTEWMTVCSHVLELEKMKTRPLSGMVGRGRLPTLIPGAGDYVLLSPPAAEGEELAPWRLFELREWGATPVAIKPPLPMQTVLRHDLLAVAPNRAAVVRVEKLDGEEQADLADEHCEYRVFVLDITPRRTVAAKGATPGKKATEEIPATAAARRVADLRLPADLGRPICAAFSADAKRLLIVVPVDERGKKHADFYEVDVDGKTPPRRVFRDADASQPQWTPDGKGVVYVRSAPGPLPWVEVVLRRLDDTNVPTVLARFPTYQGTSHTCFRWHDSGTRLTLAHHCDDGVRLVRADAGGKVLEAKWLSRDKLMVQRHLADVSRALDRAAILGKKFLPDGVAEKLKGVRRALADLKTVDQAVDDVWETVNTFETIPADPPAVPFEKMDARFRKLKIKSHYEKNRESQERFEELKRENEDLMRGLEELRKELDKPK